MALKIKEAGHRADGEPASKCDRLADAIISTDSRTFHAPQVIRATLVGNNTGTAALAFAVEKFSAVYPEAKELLRLHWEEIAPHKSLLTLNPDLNVYFASESMGLIHVITARAKGALVGYVVMMVHQHMHYRHVRVATDDIHFLHPDYRKGSAGLRLIAAAEQAMAALGVQLIAMRTKVASKHGKLFERRGYVAQDVVYTRILGGQQ